KPRQIISAARLCIIRTGLCTLYSRVGKSQPDARPGGSAPGMIFAVCKRLLQLPFAPAGFDGHPAQVTAQDVDLRLPCSRRRVFALRIGAPASSRGPERRKRIGIGRRFDNRLKAQFATPKVAVNAAERQQNGPACHRARIMMAALDLIPRITANTVVAFTN